MQEEKKEFRYRVIRIKDLSFEINEQINFEANTPAGVSFDGNLQYFEDSNRVDLIIEVGFLFEHLSQEPFMKGRVLTSFQVENLKDHIITGEVFPLEKIAMATLFGLSVTHARALIAKAAMGSKFQNYFVPVVNPYDILDLMVLKPEKPGHGGSN